MLAVVSAVYFILSRRVVMGFYIDKEKSKGIPLDGLYDLTRSIDTLTLFVSSASSSSSTLSRLYLLQAHPAGCRRGHHLRPDEFHSNSLLDHTVQSHDAHTIRSYILHQPG
jgi:hypothetical protein